MTYPLSSSAWKWSLGLGLLLLITGCIALGNLILATAVSIYLIGALLFAAGVLQLLHALQSTGRKTFWALSGLLYVLTGLFVLVAPLTASAVLTLLLGISLLLAGISRLFSLPAAAPGRGWIIFSAVITLLLGLALLAGWPADSLWVIGIFLATDLLLQGWSFLFLGIALKTRTSGHAENPAR